MDVKNGDLDKGIYKLQPPGFVAPLILSLFANLGKLYMVSSKRPKHSIERL